MLSLFFRLKGLKAARQIKMLLMDVDGTLTNGLIYLLPDGQEVKTYNVQDGLGIFLARMAGLKVGVITGKVSPALEIRAVRLGLDEVHQGILNKKIVLEEIARSNNLSLKEIAYIGDDLGDMEIMTMVGLGAAVADAHPDIKKAALYICKNKGGFGAVREFIEFILKAQGKWSAIKSRASDLR
ncbi:MAG: KdsC family phosphatase [Candidatus Saccharicenans sp.]|nr:MAG: 3-deoxy-D-manno-octulosonate 8-phosphate phosphatase [Candidatus Aminicenantes bacterium]HEK86361.1 3-deoxy-D-manno-octulosonate 8-phosphate phosphatase [Candidatus Aminicenantes bacterium]